MVGSRDMTARVFSIDPVVGFVPVTLTGHRNAIVNCFFEVNSLKVSFNGTNALVKREQELHES